MPSIDVKSITKVLSAIISDLGKLSDEQWQVLIEGKAKFKFYDENELRPVKTPKPRKDDKKEFALNEVVISLKACESKDAAELYLNKFTVSELKKIAKDLGAYYSSSSNKADVVSSLIKTTIGAHLERDSTHNL